VLKVVRVYLSRLCLNDIYAPAGGGVLIELLGLKEYLGDRNLLQGYFGRCIKFYNIYIYIIG
jgi:hypothetical protein